MIDRLKRRVFWSILLSAAGVLFVMVIAINILQQVQTRQKIDSILDSAAALLETKVSEGDHSGKHGSGKGKTELLRSISENELGLLMIDENGEIISGSDSAEGIDEDTLRLIAAAAISDEDGSGRVGSWNYKTVTCEGGTNVIFLDAASIRKENVQTLLLSLLGFAAACCVFAVLAKGLTQAIVKPVDENMQAQKRFVSDASHELKTPLTVIDANVSVLEQSFGTNKWLDYI